MMSRRGKRVDNRRLIALSLACGLVAGPKAILAQRIGLFFDPEGKTCSKQIGLYEFGDLWIIAFDVDQTRGPVVGVEFRILGYPEDWYGIIRCPSGCIATSFARDDRPRVLLAYVEPQVDRGSTVTLARIQYTSLSEVPATTLTLGAGSGSTFDTPVLIQRVDDPGCEAPGRYEFVAIPATGSFAVINGECSIAVESISWQRIKSLYRE